MAITVVNVTSSNSLTTTIPATTAGNCLIVCVMSQSGSAASVSGVTLGGVADNFAQADAGHGNNGTFFADVFIWCDPNCAGGQTSVVVSGSNLQVGSGNGGIVIYEVSGLVTSAVVDKTSHGGAGSGTNWTSGTTATTTQANEFWVGCVAGSSPSSPAGWSVTVFSPNTGNAGEQIVSSTGTAVYNGTQGNSQWAAVVATLKGLTNVNVNLPVAQVNINALPPRPPVLLPVAQVAIAAFTLTPKFTVALPVAQVNINAPIITPFIVPKLIVAIASQAGTDDYGTNFPQGILATAGVISGPVFEGPDYILNSVGAFWYSGIPAGGNLIGSIAATSGSDGFGNAYLAGITTYSVSGGTYYAMNLVGQAVSWYTASSFSAGWVALFNINSFLSDYNSAPTMQLAAPSVLLGNLGDCIWSDNGLGGSGVPQLGLSAGGGPFIPGEGWHPISGAAGLSGTFRCKLLPWNGVWIDFEGTISNTNTTFTLGSLPSAAYYPTAARHLPLALTTGATARLFIPTSGAVQVILSAAANGASIGTSLTYPTN